MRFPVRLVPLAVIALAAVLGTAAPANATVVLESSIEDMTRISTLVVQGEVVSVESRKDADGKTEGPTRIVTDVELRVKDTLKGETGETLTLTLPGGQAGEYVMHIPGMPKFRPGQEVVLFLERTKKGYAISGLQQGRFSVLPDPVTGAPVAVRTFDAGLALAKRDAEGRLDIQHAEDRLDLRYLDDLKQTVRRTVTRFGPRPELPRNGVLPPAPTVEQTAP